MCFRYIDRDIHICIQCGSVYCIHNVYCIHSVYSSVRFGDNLRNRKNLAVKGWRVPHARPPYLEIFVDWDKTHEYKDLLEILYWDKYQNLNPPTHLHTKLNYFELQSAAGGALFSQGSKVNLRFHKNRDLSRLGSLSFEMTEPPFKVLQLRTLCTLCTLYRLWSTQERKSEKSRQAETKLVGNIFLPFFHLSFVFSFCMCLKSLS